MFQPNSEPNNNAPTQNQKVQHANQYTLNKYFSLSEHFTKISEICQQN
jgi:hypothetical protein